MTFRNVVDFFPKPRGSATALLSLLLLPTLPACATATIEDAAPQSIASSAQPAAETAQATPAGPVDTGTYPNLNIVPVAETAQLTAAERAAMTAELRAARARASGQEAGAASHDPQPLRRLAHSHADEALRQIEGSE